MYVEKKTYNYKTNINSDKNLNDDTNIGICICKEIFP